MKFMFFPPYLNWGNKRFPCYNVFIFSHVSAWYLVQEHTNISRLHTAFVELSLEIITDPNQKESMQEFKLPTMTSALLPTHPSTAGE